MDTTTPCGACMTFADGTRIFPMAQHTHSVSSADDTPEGRGWCRSQSPAAPSGHRWTCELPDGHESRCIAEDGGTITWPKEKLTSLDILALVSSDSPKVDPAVATPSEVAGAVVAPKSSSSVLPLDREALRQIVEKLKARSVAYLQSARVYNREGERTLDAYYDGKHMGIDEALEALSTLLSASSSGER